MVKRFLAWLRDLVAQIYSATGDVREDEEEVVRVE